MSMSWQREQHCRYHPEDYHTWNGDSGQRNRERDPRKRREKIGCPNRLQWAVGIPLGIGQFLRQQSDVRHYALPVERYNTGGLGWQLRFLNQPCSIRNPASAGFLFSGEPDTNARRHVRTCAAS